MLDEPYSQLAEALVRAEPDLMVPDFWLHEATNVLWLKVRRKMFTPQEAREGLDLLRALVEPTATEHMRLHDVALDMGIVVNHPTYDTLYLAFAIAMGASGIVSVDAHFVQAVRTHPQSAVAKLALSLEDWANSRGFKS